MKHIQIWSEEPNGHESELKRRIKDVNGLKCVTCLSVTAKLKIQQEGPKLFVQGVTQKDWSIESKLKVNIVKY